MSAIDNQTNDSPGYVPSHGTPQSAQARTHDMKHGACIWLTGLCASGKTVTAQALTALLAKTQSLPVVLLDGDAFRASYSKSLGFSRQDRDVNVLRIAAAALDVVRAGGIAVCAAVSPYEDTRRAVRDLIGDGRFLAVFVNTPLEICERRDPKGLYAKARNGKIRNFTGIDDPYETPSDPDVELETETRSPEENARLLVAELSLRGLLEGVDSGSSN